MAIKLSSRADRARFYLACLLLALVGAPSVAAQLPSAPEGDRDTALRPGDVVQLQIYREPEMSGDFIVDESSVVVLPRLGPVSVAATPADSLKSTLTRQYLAFLNHSSVSVTLLRRIQILGAVRNPGLYPMDATMTVGDALAVAGGTTAQGNPRRLELIRGGRKVRVELSPETPISTSPIRSGDQIYVPERSWLSRNSWLVSSAIGATVTLAVTLIRYR